MDTKQVIVLRKDLNMRKGKMVAQGAHASLKVFLDAGKMHTAHGGSFELDENDFSSRQVGESVFDWLAGTFTKVCVSVNSEQELLDVYNKAKSSGLPCSLIQDAGRTEFGGIPTYTAVAIGPDQVQKIDEITGKLSLL